MMELTSGYYVCPTRGVWINKLEDNRARSCNAALATPLHAIHRSVIIQHVSCNLEEKQLNWSCCCEGKACLKKRNFLSSIAELICVMFEKCYNKTDLAEFFYFIDRGCNRTLPPRLTDSGQAQFCRKCFYRIFPFAKYSKSIQIPADRRELAIDLGNLFLEVSNGDYKRNLQNPALVVGLPYITEMRARPDVRVIVVEPQGMTDSNGTLFPAFSTDDIHVNEDNEEILSDETKSLLIVAEEKLLKEMDLMCTYRYLHYGISGCTTNYVVLAAMFTIEKTQEIEVDAGQLTRVYLHHKTNILDNLSHHNSKGWFWANGIKCDFSTKGSTSTIGHDSSIGYYAGNIGGALYQEYLMVVEQVNRIIWLGNKAIDELLESGLAVSYSTALEAKIEYLNKLYSLAKIEQHHIAKCLNCELGSLKWASSNVCCNARTLKPHNEDDVSMTFIMRPYFQKNPSGLEIGSFNFYFRNKTLKIPLLQGRNLLFSGYLMKHRQEITELECGAKEYDPSSKSFINIAAYSPGRIRNNLTKTVTRLFDHAVREQFGV